MKGVVFTEFLTMVEDRFGLAVVDRIVEQADLASGGAYTAVGTYDHREMVRLVTALAKDTGASVPDLLRECGRHMFGCFARRYPQFFVAKTDCLTFLSGIEDYIHVEVRKLYPDAELPYFEVEFPDAHRLLLVYRSCRPLGAFAEGLIQGAIDYFREAIALESEDCSDASGSCVRFRLTRLVS